MVRGIILFLLAWATVTIGINVWRSLTGKEKWNIIKCVSYGAVTALIALLLIVGIVFVF